MPVNWKDNLQRLIACVKKNGALPLGAVIGFCAAGLWGFLTGIVAVVFIQRIVARHHEEKKLERCFELVQSVPIDEPFSGAAFLCAIAVSFCHDTKYVILQVKSCFLQLAARSVTAQDIQFLQLCCSAVQRVKYVNTDLLIEALAARLPLTEDGAAEQAVENVLCETARISTDPAGNTEQVRYFSLLLEHARQTDERARSCAVLGVSYTDSPETIRAAHRKLAALYHPDMTGDSAANKAAAEEFLRIQRAYESLIR